MAFALGVFVGTEAEVEAQFEQSGDVTGHWIRGGGSCGYDGLENSHRDGFFLLDWGIFYPISFELTDKAPVQANISLGVGGFLREDRTFRRWVAAIPPHASEADFSQFVPLGALLGGRHKEVRSRGTGHDPTSLKHRKGEVWITVDVVLNI